MSEIVKKAAEISKIKINEPEAPFRWSEDFGHYLKNTAGAFFGLGAGLRVPALHNPDYDFPDTIIDTGIKLFYNILFLLDNNEDQE